MRIFFFQGNPAMGFLPKYPRVPLIVVVHLTIFNRKQAILTYGSSNVEINVGTKIRAPTRAYQYARAAVIVSNRIQSTINHNEDIQIPMYVIWNNAMPASTCPKSKREGNR